MRIVKYKIFFKARLAKISLSSNQAASFLYERDLPREEKKIVARP